MFVAFRSFRYMNKIVRCIFYDCLNFVILLYIFIAALVKIKAKKSRLCTFLY